jgi:hypothetical protein
VGVEVDEELGLLAERQEPPHAARAELGVEVRPGDLRRKRDVARGVVWAGRRVVRTGLRPAPLAGLAGRSAHPDLRSRSPRRPRGRRGGRRRRRRTPGHTERFGCGPQARRPRSSAGWRLRASAGRASRRRRCAPLPKACPPAAARPGRRRAAPASRAGCAGRAGRRPDRTRTSSAPTLAGRAPSAAENSRAGSRNLPCAVRARQPTLAPSVNRGERSDRCAGAPPRNPLAPRPRSQEAIPGTGGNGPGEAHRAAAPSRQHPSPGTRRGGPARRPPLCLSSVARSSATFAGLSRWLPRGSRANRKGGHMPTWVWILLIVLLVLVLFGGVGYGRRGV